MAAGCKIIGFGSPLIQEIVNQSQGGIICNTVDDAVKQIPLLTAQHSQNSMNYITENNNYKQFRDGWNSVFEQLSKKVYTR